jgi:hypothetical protein
MGIWLGPYKMHKILKNTRFGNVKLGLGFIALCMICWKTKMDILVQSKHTTELKQM